MPSADQREPSKYGAELTSAAFRGLPLRVGRFESDGCLESLTAPVDTVLVWSGGVSNVTLCTPRARHVFQRRSGMIDILPAGTRFERVEWKGEPSECISAALTPEHVSAWLDTPQAAFDPDRGLRLALTDPHVVDLVQRLRAQATLGQPWGSLYVESLSLTLASYLYGRYGASARALPESSLGLAQAECERLTAFIEEHLGENISLEHLSKLIGYGPDHFARLFKRAFGEPPHRYVLGRRIERAKAMLRDPSRSILEVALACGFSSQAHLNAAFKARTALTPGAYRKG
jgi:AraC family transcriptional regulator